MITPLRVFGLTSMFMLVSPVWAAPTVRVDPCVRVGCVSPALVARQAVNCLCGGTFTRVSIVSGRLTRLALRPGEQAVPLQVNSRILGTGSRYLVTSDARLAAQLRQGFKVDGVKSFRDQATITISLLR